MYVINVNVVVVCNSGQYQSQNRMRVVYYALKYSIKHASRAAGKVAEF